MTDFDSNGFLGLLTLVYDKDGFWPFIFLLLLIVASIVVYKYFEIIVSNIFNKNKKKIHSLKDHVIFQKIDALTNHVIKSIHIECPLRDKVFKRVLNIRFQIMSNLLKEFTSVPDDIAKENLKIMWEAYFAKLENEWYEEVKKIGIPRIVVQKYYDIREGFHKLIAETVCSLCEKEMSTHECISIIFDMINGMEVASLQITLKAINSLNGELSTIEFEGTKCMHCKDMCIFKAENHGI